MDADASSKTLNDVRKYFQASEYELQHKINDVLDKIRKHSEGYGKNKGIQSIDLECQKQNETASQRNRNIIKYIEHQKAKLRSQYYFQPATRYFNQQLDNYKSYAKKKI